ncbi:MAG: zinc ribbon domain-containing protein [Acidobacteria bacterium]|nr:zinc ribbon domain-containing protein [Acidobacteriota bacterium]
MPFCTNCGAQVEGRFCPSCGNSMGEPAQPAEQPTTPPPPSGPPPGPVGPAVGQPPQSAPPKKKSPWLWVMVGCFGLILLVVLGILGTGLFIAHKAKQAGFDTELMKRNPALAAAKIAVAMNPAIEIASSDESAGTVTLREKETGKTVTLNLDDLKNGRIVFTDENGQKATIQGGEDGSFKVKSKEGTFEAGGKWSPPDWLPTYAGATVEGGSHIQSPASDGGTGALTTSDSVDDVLKFYEDALKGMGMKVSKTVSSADNARTGTVSGKDDVHKKNVAVVATSEGGSTKIVINYSASK